MKKIILALFLALTLVLPSAKSFAGSETVQPVKLPKKVQQSYDFVVGSLLSSYSMSGAIPIISSGSVAKEEKGTYAFTILLFDEEIVSRCNGQGL
jgi:hypothetical protein